MRTTQRFMTLVGLALATGATIGMTATAASAAPAAPESSSSSESVQDRPGDRDGRWGHDRRGRSWVVGRYDSRRACEWAGRIGERNGWWDEYDCDRSRRGWVLEVERHRRGWRP